MDTFRPDVCHILIRLVGDHSRSRGAFAGIALQGATLREDLDANASMYKERLSTKEIVRDSKVKATPDGEKFIAVLTKYSS